MSGRALWALPLLAMASCQPSFDDRESLVTGPRILAVRGDPAESSPGQGVSYEALVVTPEGASEGADLRWAFCAAPKLLTENNVVSADCLGGAARPIEGALARVTATTPADACALFGPDTPPGGLRPRDPDATGGFYQPVRVFALGAAAFGLERVTCNLPNAPLDAAVELAERYIPNRNPKLLPLRAAVGGAETPLDALPAGRGAHLEVGWSAEDAEPFLAFDPRTQAIVHRREALRVSWFATAGAFERDVTGRAEEDAATAASNVWTAPEEPGPVFLWIVLRDSRGGVDFAAYTLEVAAPVP